MAVIVPYGEYRRSKKAKARQKILESRAAFAKAGISAAEVYRESRKELEEFRIGNFEQASDYNDDTCFFFGAQKIYLKRHIVRAFEESKSKLLPLLR
ncbi:MAG: hypothetical protein ACE5EN_05500 [Nitrospinota bacterium]